MSILARVVFILSIAGPSLSAANIWTGSSGKFQVNWTTSDITVARRDQPKQQILSLRKEAAAQWAEITKDSEDHQLQSATSLRILSVVGNILSVEEVILCDCGGAHPTASKRFRAIDMDRSSPAHTADATLSDLIPAEVLYTALKSDKLVKQALSISKAPVPSSLANLLKVITYQPIEVGDCTYAFGPDALSNFAFNSSANGQVAVRLSLSHYSEICRGQMVQVGIQVPIPAAWKQALEEATNRSSGFLMTDAKKGSPTARKQASNSLLLHGYGNSVRSHRQTEAAGAPVPKAYSAPAVSCIQNQASHARNASLKMEQ